MKKNIIYIFIFLVAIILQTSVLPVVAGGDAVAMAVLAFSIIDGFYAFFYWTIFAGIAYDFFSYSNVGTHTIVFLFIIYFVSFFSRRFSVEHRFVGKVLFFIFIVVATFFLRTAIAFEAAWEMQTLRGFWETFGNLKFFISEIIYNTILFFLWFMIIKKAKNFFDIK